MNKPSTYEKEMERQNSAQADLVMKQNADPGKTMKAVEALQSNSMWFNASDNSVNQPLLVAQVIDRHGLQRNAAGYIIDSTGKKQTDDDLGHLLRDEISKYLPGRAAQEARNIFKMLKDRIPAAATEYGPDDMLSYMAQHMQGEIKVFQSGAKRKTGFPMLDAAIGGIYPGLYVIAAATAQGKTTITHQIADQMAAAGHHVLFFSLEMSRLEMATKSLARMTAKLDKNTAVTSLSIRLGSGGAPVQNAIRAYVDSIGDRLSVIEGDFSCTVPYVAEYTRAYIERTRERPTVFVDYLQILQPSADMQRAQIREAIDVNVSELKRLSRTLNIPIFVISSISRTYYLAPISAEALKESGGIEYSADCVMGLQFSCMNEAVFKDKSSTWTQKNERFQNAKHENPRKIDLVVLKTRFGSPDIVGHFDYFPRYDLFEETGIDGTDVRTGYQISDGGHRRF